RPAMMVFANKSAAFLIVASCAFTASSNRRHCERYCCVGVFIIRSGSCRSSRACGITGRNLRRTFREQFSAQPRGCPRFYGFSTFGASQRGESQRERRQVIPRAVRRFALVLDRAEQFAHRTLKSIRK